MTAAEMMSNRRFDEKTHRLELKGSLFGSERWCEVICCMKRLSPVNQLQVFYCGAQSCCVTWRHGFILLTLQEETEFCWNHPALLWQPVHSLHLHMLKRNSHLFVFTFSYSQLFVWVWRKTWLGTFSLLEFHIWLKYDLWDRVGVKIDKYEDRYDHL